MPICRHACPSLAVAGEHPRRPHRTQVPVTGERRTGPLPDVLARLAVGMPASDTGRGRSARARVLGYVLCVATASLVLAAAIIVAQP